MCIVRIVRMREDRYLNAMWVIADKVDLLRTVKPQVMEQVG